MCYLVSVCLLQVGMFFGEVDGDIMFALHNKTFYERYRIIICYDK